MLIAAVWSLQVTVLFVGGMRQAAWQGEGLPRSLRMLLSASLVAAAYLVYVNAGAQTAAYARAAKPPAAR